MARQLKSAANGATRANAPTDEVIFEYIKSPMFRTAHADGAIGGITPQGYLHLAFYNERPAIPKAIVHKVNSNGTLGAMLPERTISRPGIIREMDVDVVLSPEALDALIKWLNEQKEVLARVSQARAKVRKRKK